jgi:sugar lactone lactonase YvrE
MIRSISSVCQLLILSAMGVGLFFQRAQAAPQKVETVDGVRIVHNAKGGEWGNNPRISIKLIRTIGDINTADDNLAFNDPQEIAADSSGNIYILDSGNYRIQKFAPDGRFLMTIGRKGQGPGEFGFPRSFGLDTKGFIYVLDGTQKRIVIFTPDGKDHKIVLTAKLNLSEIRLMKSGVLAASGYVVFGGTKENSQGALPKLAKLIDAEGNLLTEFGERLDFGDKLTDATANYFHFDVDGRDNILLCFASQNRIEKYSPEGQLLWRADRELNYSTKLIERAKREVTSTSTKFTAAKLNRVSAGVAADDRGRVWVVTLDRQIRKEEEVSMVVSYGPTGASRKIEGNTDLQTTDIYKLEIYAPDGVLLGEIPLTQFVDGICLMDDKLFLLDRDRGVKLYEYQITER